MEKYSYVYILASEQNGTLYVGVTSNLQKRVWEHKEALVEGFTRKYGIHDLVWYETHGNIYEAIKREKQLKNWKREWKLKLIEKENLNWSDLYKDL